MHIDVFHIMLYTRIDFMIVSFIPGSICSSSNFSYSYGFIVNATSGQRNNGSVQIFLPQMVHVKHIVG